MATAKKEAENAAVETAAKEEIVTGPAKMRCFLEDEIREFDIEVMKVDQETAEINKGMMIRVTDEELLEKYLEIEHSYPDYVVAYRLGDFYEVFGEKAVRISEECNLTLTGRDVGLENRIPAFSVNDGKGGSNFFGVKGVLRPCQRERISAAISMAEPIAGEFSRAAAMEPSSHFAMNFGSSGS